MWLLFVGCIDSNPFFMFDIHIYILYQEYKRGRMELSGSQFPRILPWEKAGKRVVGYDSAS